MRITTVRVITQAIFFGLFLFLIYVTQYTPLHDHGYPASFFLEVDPLVVLTTGLTTHVVYRALLTSLLIFVPTLLLGRVFCNWICPMGTLMQFSGWLFNKRKQPERIASNRHKPLYRLKYYILVFIVLAAVCGTAQNGWLDPQPTLYRSFTIGVLPLLAKLGVPLYVHPAQHQFAWVVLAMFAAFVGLNLLVPRFFCRVLCPLGALLGWLSRWSLWRIERDPVKCTDCDLCLKSCEGASDPFGALRKSECFVCFNCLEDCPYDALSFQMVPPRAHEVTEPDVGRRATLVAGTLGVLYYGISRSSGETDRNFKPSVVRPPGSVAEPEFLERCIKCDQCIRVCPTNVLQPAMFEAGIEGVFTPVMNMRMGYCELNCTLCGQVCPTGAIQKISVAQKQGLGEFAEQGTVKVGTAFYDRGRCLPWAMDKPCVVCQEVCPVSPKAIYTREVVINDRWGQPVTLQRPYVDPVRCIGCGICEHECPVPDLRAIRITAAGETRSKERSLLLEQGNSKPAGVAAPSSAPTAEATSHAGTADEAG